MNSKEAVVIIRQAQFKDENKIWNILHANSRTWTLEQIHQKIDGLFVLIIGHTMLGVLGGDFKQETGIVDWIEIHPFYPEKILKDLLLKGLLGVTCHGIGVKVLSKGFPKIIHFKSPPRCMASLWCKAIR